MLQVEVSSGDLGQVDGGPRRVLVMPQFEVSSRRLVMMVISPVPRIW